MKKIRTKIFYREHKVVKDCFEEDEIVYEEYEDFVKRAIKFANTKLDAEGLHIDYPSDNIIVVSWI